MTARAIGRVLAWCGFVALPLALFAVFYARPVYEIVARGVGEGSPFETWRASRTRSVVWFTIWQAVASTLLTFVVAIPATAVISRFDFRGRAAVRTLVTIPFVLPTVVVATAFSVLVRPFGSLRFSIWTILAAHVFYNLSIVVRVVGNVWERTDTKVADAARTLGASRCRAFVAVTLPQLRGALVAAATLVFLFTFTSFGVIVILGGARYDSLETEIYRETVERLHLSTAAALAIAQLLIVVVIVTATNRLQERLARRTSAPLPRRRPRRAEFIGVGAALAPAVVIVLAPLGQLVRSALRAGAYSAIAHPSAGPSFVSASTAIRNSLEFAAIAVMISVTAGLMLATAIVRAPRRFGRVVDTIAALPLGTSPVTLGFGLLIGLPTSVLGQQLDLRASRALIPIAHSLVALPFVVRVLVPMLRSIDHRWREAAAVLGAPPWRVWSTVDLALTWRAVLVAAGFATTISLGEFGATALIARPDAATVPVAIFRALGRPGQVAYAQALGMSAILMLVTGALIASIDRLRPSSPTARGIW